MHCFHHLRKAGLLAGALAILGPSISSAGESTRLVALRLPAEAVAAVRAELNAPEKSAKPETMAAVLKRRGVAVIADIQQENPWRGEPVEFSKVTGEIESAGDVLELGMTAELEGLESGGAVDVRISADLWLPTGGQGVYQLEGIGMMRLAEPGRWRERQCWGAAKEAVMLWEYPVGFPVGAKPGDGDGRVPVRVEMKWFPAGEADLARLAKSQPETREKALEWLEGRARPAHEALYWIQPGNPSAWRFCAGKHDHEDDKMLAEDGLRIETNGVAKDGLIQLDWELEFLKNWKEQKVNLSAKLQPGIWEFLPMEGVAGVNVVACRVTKP